MKSVMTIIFLMGAWKMAACDAITTGTEPDESGRAVAQQIFDAYEFYKEKDLNSCKEVMEQLSFQKTKEVVKQIESSCTLDSMIFENPDLGQWAYYKSVDLQYLRTLEAVIVVKHDQNLEIFEHLQYLLRLDGNVEMATCQEYGKNAKFSDPIGAYVMDERFIGKPVTRIPSLYDHELSIQGDYLIVSFTEVVPDTMTNDLKLSGKE